MIIKLDKDVYSTLTEAGPPVFGLTKNINNSFGIDYNVGYNKTKFDLATTIYNAKVRDANIIQGGLLYGLENIPGGLIGLVLSLFLVIGALTLMVSALKKIAFGKAKASIDKALNMNDYLAIFLGILATLVVQSSSIVTSTLVPLVAVGSLRVGKSLPLCIGSNIGTCFTAMLAAVASDNVSVGLQIAIIHLIFNVLTFLAFFPIQRLRNIPIGLAKALGKAAAFHKAVPIMYMIYCYMFVPGIVFAVGMSEAHILNTSLAFFFIALPGILWWKFIWPRSTMYDNIFNYDEEVLEESLIDSVEDGDKGYIELP